MTSGRRSRLTPTRCCRMDVGSAAWTSRQTATGITASSYHPDLAAYSRADAGQVMIDAATSELVIVRTVVVQRVAQDELFGVDFGVGGNPILHQLTGERDRDRLRRRKGAERGVVAARHRLDDDLDLRRDGRARGAAAGTDLVADPASLGRNHRGLASAVASDARCRPRLPPTRTRRQSNGSIPSPTARDTSRTARRGTVESRG